MRPVARVLGTVQLASSPLVPSRTSTWNEHFILSTLQESAARTSCVPSERRRYSTSPSPATNAPSVMEAFIKLVKLKAQRHSRFRASVDAPDPSSGIATDSYKSLQQRALLSDIEAANDIGDTQRSRKLISSLYNPRTNLPSTAEVWVQQLRIYRLTKQGQPALDALTLHIPSCGIVPTPSMYSAVLRALGASGMGSKIIPILEDMKRRRYWPSEEVLYDAIAGLIASNMKDEAVNLFSSPFVIHPILFEFDRLVNTPSNLLGLQSRHSIKPNRYHYQLVIELYCVDKKRQKALALLKEMLRLQIPPTESSISAVARGLLNKPVLTASEIQAAIQEYHSMLEKLKAPAEESRSRGEGFYVFVLSSLQSHPDLNRTLAHSIVQQIWARRIKFSSALLNAVMEAYMYAGDATRALGIFRNVVLGARFTGYLRYFSPLPNVNTASSSSDEIKATRPRTRVVPNDATLRLLLRICYDKADWQLAVKYWNLFVEIFEVKVSSKSLGLLVGTLCSVGKRDMAMDEIEKAKKSLLIEADSSVLAGMVEWCFVSNRFDLADDIYDAAEQARLPMNEQLGTNLIEVYGKTSNLEKAVQVWLKMKQHKSTTSSAAARMVLLIATHYGVDKASAFYQDFVSTGGKVTRFLSYMMMRVYTWYGSLEDAVNFVDQVQQQSGIPPDMTHFAHLFKMCGRAGDLDKVCQIFDLYQQREDWIFTKEFCLLVISTFQSKRIGGMSLEDAQIAKSWLDLAVKPLRTPGGKATTRLGLERPDKLIFITMVRGWIAHARSRTRNASPASPLVPLIEGQQHSSNRLEQEQ